MKPEVRVFEITSPTKKISRNITTIGFLNSNISRCLLVCDSSYIILFYLPLYATLLITVCDF